MNSTIYKAIIITAIVALVAGFFGGYEFKNLNAAAPVAPATGVSSLSKTDKDSIVVSSKMKGVITDSVIQAINTNGMQKVFGVAPISSANSSTKLASTTSGELNPTIMNQVGQAITNFLLPKALAQLGTGGGVCGGDPGLVGDAITKLAGTAGFDLFRLPCTKSVRAQGGINFSLYSDVWTCGTNEDGSVCLYTGQELVLSGSGSLIYTGSKPDGKGGCVPDTLVIPWADEQWSIYNINNQGWSEDPGTGTLKTRTFVCSGRVTYDHTFDNPAYDAKKCCGLKP